MKDVDRSPRLHGEYIKIGTPDKFNLLNVSLKHYILYHFQKLVSLTTSWLVRAENSLKSLEVQYTHSYKNLPKPSDLFVGPPNWSITEPKRRGTDLYRFLSIGCLSWPTAHVRIYTDHPSPYTVPHVHKNVEIATPQIISIMWISEDLEPHCRMITELVCNQFLV